MVEVYGNPDHPGPVKMNRHVPTRWRWNRRKADRSFRKVWKMIEEHRVKQEAL